MKKLLIFHHYNSAIGAGMCLLHIVQSICEDYKVTVVLPSGGDLGSMLTNMGITTICYPNTPVAYEHYNGSHVRFISMRHFTNIIKIYKNSLIIRNIINEQKPDYVAVNSMTLCWIGIVSNKMGIPSVCFHRETYRKGLLGVRTYFMKKILLRYFDGIAYISDYDRHQTGDTDKVAVRITDKVDFELYKNCDKTILRNELSLPKDSKLILFTGGCSKLKGGLIAVEALKYISDANIKLVFLQYEPDLEVTKVVQKIKEVIKRILHKNYKYIIETTIQKNKISDRVIFKPSTNCVHKYFLACDVAIFPSEEAHQARPIYEAGAAQIPIIISDFVNTQEFLTEKNGYLFTPHDAKNLSTRIIECFEDLDLQKRKTELNYIMAKKNHDLRDLRFEIIDFFEMAGRKLCNGRK